MEHKKKYDVFISYSRTDYLDDNNIIINDSPIDNIIKTFDKKKIKYWIDIDGDNASNQYMAKIAKAISNSEKVIFVSSKNSNSPESYWPIKEILFASEKHMEIVPIRIDNCEFHDNITLALAGLDAIEYYKNPEQSVEKLLNIISHKKSQEGISEVSANLRRRRKCRSIIGMLLMGLLACSLFFATFFTIGFCVGLFSNLADEEIVLEEAFRKRRIEVVDNHIIEFSGDKLRFKYDIESGLADFEKNDLKLFDEISFEKIVMSVSIPLAFKRLFKVTQHSGNGKSKVAVLVAGAIGIICGYTIGEQMGVSCALIKNEEALKDYLNKDSTKQMLREKIKYIN